MIKIGTHNSWSYASPVKWWFPHFMSKCQNVDIRKQYELGSRLFDLRLRLEGDDWFVSHGPCLFDVDWRKDLLWLDNLGEVYVRVILEYNNEPNNDEYIIKKFREYCKILEESYVNIKFIDGRCKWNWNIVYEFQEECPPLLDLYSSTTSLFENGCKFLRFIDDLWPWLYAKLRNQSNYDLFIKEGKCEYLFIDFIDLIKKKDVE